MNLVIKDASRQIIGRVWSALVWFLVLKIISPYLWTLRYGDYSTIIAYFAIWSALADFGVYVIWLKKLWSIKNKYKQTDVPPGKEVGRAERSEKLTGGLKNESIAFESSNSRLQDSIKEELSLYYSKFFSTRIFMICIVYVVALAVAYMIPSYRSNPYLVRALPMGMLYSALFMFAGIIQTPLQLYRKMEQVSIWLLLARASQIILILLTVYVRYTWIEFSNYSSNSLIAFVLIILSLVISAATQARYVHQKAKKYIQLRRVRDWTFTKELLLANRQYWFAYYLSSFHTLIVTILLSIFFATTAWFDYAWTRWLALQLMSILLIIPSALGNSLIHKLADETLENKKKSFGALLHLVFWIWCAFIIWFSGFWTHVVNFIGGSDYISSWWSIGSDFLLPFLGIVLTLSFVKQVFNYIFVSTNLQNKLLYINLIWVAIWSIIWIPLVLKYNLLWWLAMQILLEVCFLWWALFVARKNDALPHVSLFHITWLSWITWLISRYIYIRWANLPITWWMRLVYACIVSWTMCALSFPWLKKTMKQL